MIFFPEDVHLNYLLFYPVPSPLWFDFQVRKREQQSIQSTDRKSRESSKSEKGNDEAVAPNARVQYLKDQLVQAKLYLSLSATRNNVNFIRQLRQRMKEVQRTLGRANKDSQLPRK